MKRKPQHRLNRTRFNSVVIAVIGGQSFHQALPIDYGTTIKVSKEKPKEAKGFSKILKPKSIFTKKSEE